MAATRLMALHVTKDKTVAKCLSDRTDYSENEKKTENGKYISSYECDPKTCDKEFLLAKRQYFHMRGFEPKGNVIAYQIRQSFKPGEVTPEEANAIGYETAMRWTKGNHAFIVATHVDKAHIHNHIIYNSTNLTCDRKWRDFFRSGKALQKVSDIICLEHGLSVITPRPYGQRSKYRNPSWRLRPVSTKERDFSLVLDMQKIIEKNKGDNYERWAKRFNMKQVAKSLCYIQEHGIKTIEELITITDNAAKRFDELSASINSKQKRLEEISELKKHIADFAKTRDVYEAYKRSGYSKKFYEDHREELQLRKAAKEYFNNNNITKIPKMNDLSEEYGRILEAKRKEYSEYKEAKASMQDLMIARQNIETIMNSDGKVLDEKKRQEQHQK